MDDSHLPSLPSIAMAKGVTHLVWFVDYEGQRYASGERHPPRAERSSRFRLLALTRTVPLRPPRSARGRCAKCSVHARALAHETCNQSGSHAHGGGTSLDR